MEPTVEYKSGDLDAYHSEYLWIVVVGLFAAFFMAWGIGANDVANSFASSVGSKALTLKQAVAIATVMEFVGTVSMGAAVTDTVSKGIVDAAYFKENPEVLQLGMLASLIGAGLWLALCSFLGSPVSTTHSIIGSLIGISLCTNAESLNGQQVGLVVLSWVTSPVLSGMFSALIFWVVRKFVLRSENAVERGFLLFPLLLWITFVVFCFYVIFKNSQVEIKNFVTDTPGFAALVALVISLVLTSVTYLTSIKKIKQWVAEVPDETAPAAEAGNASAAEAKPKGKFWNQDLHAAACEEEAQTAEIHAASEKFPAKTEKLFTYLQVISAAFDSLAHGANDAANAVGPFAAIWGIHEAGKIDSKVEVPVWIMVIGGAGISIGLLTYGYNVIKSIGIKLTKITPSRGFSIEMGSSLVVIIGSSLGIPLSTTHCQVGSTVGVGMCESNGFRSVGKGVNWKLMGKVAFMWVATLVFSGICSSAVFGFLSAAYHPMSKPLACGNIMNHISSKANVLSNVTKKDMQSLFASLDKDGDELLDSKELKAQGMDKTLAGDAVVEKYGRRRRRTPTTISETDLLEFTCLDKKTLDHMFVTKCEPRCLPGFRANKDLSCKLSSGVTADQGGFMLTVSYSGFSACKQMSR